MHVENQNRFCGALLPLIAEAGRVKYYCGGRMYCSFPCGGEDPMTEYRFLDAGRIQLRCGHFSTHVQCTLSLLRLSRYCYPHCPIGDSAQCRWQEVNQKSGPDFYWGQEQYHAFFRAFLRNQALVDALLNP